VASRRRWNEQEVRYFREKARAWAKSEIERRMKRYGLDPKNFEGYMERATGYIEEFVETFLVSKSRSRAEKRVSTLTGL